MPPTEIERHAFPVSPVARIEAASKLSNDLQRTQRQHRPIVTPVSAGSSSYTEKGYKKDTIKQDEIERTAGA